MHRKGLVALLVFAALIAVDSYTGRLRLQESQVQGCERSKLDRRANAAGWRQAEYARRRSGDVDVARVYARIAAGLEQRSRIRCADVFPKPSLLPLK